MTVEQLTCKQPWSTPVITHLHRSRDDVYGEQLFRVEKEDLQIGNYTIGVFNMDYFVHQTFSYQLVVRAVHGNNHVPVVPTYAVALRLDLFMCAMPCTTC
jgi:hypothetical protein